MYGGLTRYSVSVYAGFHPRITLWGRWGEAQLAEQKIYMYMDVLSIPPLGGRGVWGYAPLGKFGNFECSETLSFSFLRVFNCLICHVQSNCRDTIAYVCI